MALGDDARAEHCPGVGPFRQQPLRVVYTTSTITGNADKLLEQGELLEVTINLTQNAGMAIPANKTFTLELKPPSGSFMVIQRTTPASMAASVIDLN